MNTEPEHNKGEPQNAETAAIRNPAPLLSRRDAIGRFAFYGATMALLQHSAAAREGASGSYSNAAVALPAGAGASPVDELTKAVQIARAMRAGPLEISRDATVAGMDAHGNMASVPRAGSNEWVCVPGDENRVGDPPMCVDKLGMQYRQRQFRQYGLFHRG